MGKLAEVVVSAGNRTMLRCSTNCCISYNFADGARALIGLVVGICDLKPLIFWLTIASQFELAERFGELPFALVGKAKPSLDRNRNVISGARNRAFHDLFSFGRPFHGA